MLATHEQLLNDGYINIDDYTYKKKDEESGMYVELEFNKETDQNNNIKIENNILKILTRQD